MHDPDLIERCAHAAREVAPVTRLMSLAVTRAVLAEFLAVIREPAMAERIYDRLSGGWDMPIVEAAAPCVLEVLAREVEGDLVEKIGRI